MSVRSEARWSARLVASRSSIKRPQRRTTAASRVKNEHVKYGIQPRREQPIATLRSRNVSNVTLWKMFPCVSFTV